MLSHSGHTRPVKVKKRILEISAYTVYLFQIMAIKNLEWNGQKTSHDTVPLKPSPVHNMTIELKTELVSNHISGSSVKQEDFFQQYVSIFFWLQCTVHKASFTILQKENKKFTWYTKVKQNVSNYFGNAAKTPRHALQFARFLLQIML